MRPPAFQALVDQTLASRQQFGECHVSIENQQFSKISMLEWRRSPQFGPPLRREVDFEADLGSHNRKIESFPDQK
ncbi:hypothetical protein AB3480_15695 [Rhizobium mongolense]|uniref:hypothetical protein n=1 Tax=Rhizobium mongolense TaxID=57676 RepID=UPI0034A4D094